MEKVYYRVKNPKYILKKGDVLTLYGEPVYNVIRGIAQPEEGGGYVVDGAGGMTAEEVLWDYDAEQEVAIWTTSEQRTVPIKLALNKKFSHPLPLP